MTIIVFLKTSQNLSKPLKTSQNLSKPLKTSQNLSKPLKTSQNLSKPLKTSQNLSKPLKTSQNLSKPLKTSQNLSKPLKTSTSNNKLISLLRLKVKEEAKQQLERDGIPKFQRKGYVKGKSEKAFRCITPQGYGDLQYNLERYRRYKNNIPRNKEDCLWIAKGEQLDNGKKAKKDVYYKIPKRDDAFLLYLGIPQKNNSFGISDYQPIKSKDTTKIYFKPNYWTHDMKQYLLDNLFSGMIPLGKEFSKYKKTSEYYSLSNKIEKENNFPGYSETEFLVFQKKFKKLIINERSSVFDQKTKELKKEISWENPKMAERVMDNPLGDFTLSWGEDEKGKYFSIYDIWDLEPFKNGDGSSYGYGQRGETVKLMIQKLLNNNIDVDENTEISTIFGAGMPFEIYDRIYYDPETKKILP